MSKEKEGELKIKVSVDFDTIFLTCLGIVYVFTILGWAKYTNDYIASEVMLTGLFIFIWCVVFATGRFLINLYVSKRAAKEV